MRRMIILGTVLFATSCIDRTATDQFERAISGEKGKKVARATEPQDPAVVANRIVGEQLLIKEGELVGIRGTVHDLALIDELVLAVEKRGAHPLVLLKRPELARRYFGEVPPSRDASAYAEVAKVYEILDAEIDLGEGDPALRSFAPPDRLAVLERAAANAAQVASDWSIRRLVLGNGLYPHPGVAKQYGLTEAQLGTIFWKGVDVDYAALQATGERVRKAIERGQRVQITAPNGTDLTVSIDDRSVFVSDGVISDDDLMRGGSATTVWVPAGEAYVTPEPGSANGTIVLERIPFAGGEIHNFKATFIAGKLAAYTADITPAFRQWTAEYEASSAGKEDFAVIDIGINRALDSEIATGLPTWMRSGMVTVGVGDNRWAGGENEPGFSAFWHLPNATLKVDDQVVVQNGELKI